LKTAFNVHIRDVARPLVLLCAVLSAGVCLLLIPLHSGPAMSAAAVLAIIVGLLAWRVYGYARAIHSRAEYHAETAAEAERHYFQVLCEVAKAMEDRNRFFAGRSERISELVTQMAGRLGLDGRRSELLGMIARVHDIGLLSVPESVLLKPTGLNGPEFGAVKRHCQVGQDILKPLTFLAPVLDAIRHHHERLNGTGYPDGLKGREIPIEAMILAVADSYEAMTHDRPHRGALSCRQAVSELLRCAEIGYDAECIKALAETVNAEDLLSQLSQHAVDHPNPGISTAISVS